MRGNEQVQICPLLILKGLSQKGFCNFSMDTVTERFFSQVKKKHKTSTLVYFNKGSIARFTVCAFQQQWENIR